MVFSGVDACQYCIMSPGYVHVKKYLLVNLNRGNGAVEQVRYEIMICDYSYS
jgi:hypothetical protein